MIAMLGTAILLLFALPIGEAAAEPVLTVTRLGDPHSAREFDIPDLEALGVEDVVTTTPWNDQPIRFSGIRMERLLELWPGEAKELRVVALNDYAATIPAEDIRRYRIILASRRAGQAMRVRDKGPLWIIYPLTDEPALNVPLSYDRMVWQVTSIDVR